MTSDPMLPLPGLEPPKQSASDLEVAIRRTLVALDEAGFVQEVDAGKLQLAIELADVIASKKRTGRASTIGHDARVLMEILDKFKDEVSEVDASLSETMKRWEERLHDDRAAGAAEVRDSS